MSSQNNLVYLVSGNCWHVSPPGAGAGIVSHTTAVWPAAYCALCRQIPVHTPATLDTVDQGSC